MPGATTSLHHPLVQTPISAESGRAGLQDCRRRASHSRSASVRLDQRGWGGGQPGLHDRARSPPHRSGQCRHRLPRPRTCGNGAYRLCRSVPRRETGHIEQWGPDRKGRTRASVRSPVDGAAKRCRDLDARRSSMERESTAKTEFCWERSSAALRLAGDAHRGTSGEGAGLRPARMSVPAGTRHARNGSGELEHTVQASRLSTRTARPGASTRLHVQCVDRMVWFVPGMSTSCARRCLIATPRIGVSWPQHRPEGCELSGHLRRRFSSEAQSPDGSSQNAMRAGKTRHACPQHPFGNLVHETYDACPP